MTKLFDVIPNNFFNYLGSGSNNRIYADCLQVIYNEYDREITFKMNRERLRDAGGQCDAQRGGVDWFYWQLTRQPDTGSRDGAA